MYDAIRMQPDAFAEVCQSNVSPVDAAADRLPNAARIWLLGIGTSFHAAKIGKRLLEGSFPGIVRACHSFDFVTDAPAVGSKDAALVISHRGTKLYSRLSAERTRKAGAFTVAIVGKSSQQPPPADLVLETVEQELSPAHTVSFMGSVAMLSAIAAEISTRGQSAAVFPDRKLLAEIPAAIQKVIDSEPHIERLATDMAAARKIWIVGAGADQIAAQECALKIMET
jgi:glutamine---fructose-6-phosphate transaminase (isomerizing)